MSSERKFRLFRCAKEWLAGLASDAQALLVAAFLGVAGLAVPLPAQVPSQDIYNPAATWSAPTGVPQTPDSVPMCKDAGGQILIDFEGCGDRVDVGTAYSGCGVSFTPGALSIISGRDGGSGNFTNEPSHKTILFFLNGQAARMNVPTGFVGGFSFYYCSPDYNGYIDVYSGPDGTGIKLAHLVLPLTPRVGDADYYYDNWQRIGVQFSGIARSVDFGGTANKIGFDNITLGSSSPSTTQLANFVFSTFPNVTVGAAFQVVVKAVDQYGNVLATFNERANLALSPSGILNLRSLQFAAGTATANLICATPTLGQGETAVVGSGVRLTATSGSVAGNSNLFQVLSTSTAKGEVVLSVRLGQLSGTLTAKCDSGTANHQEVGWSASGPVTMTARFKNLASGPHTFQATLHTSSQDFNSELITMLVVPGKVLSNAVSLTGKRAVILIPGIMGSTSSEGSFLPFLAWPAPLARTDLTTYKFWTKTGFDELEAALSPSFTVRRAPWDWRVPVEQASDRYLLPLIDELKAAGYSKVDIIAHSMGGLMTRAYLQKYWYTRKDVDRFIMLGTPNAGSANPYWMWFGGEPETIDHITGSLLQPDTYDDVTKDEIQANPDYRDRFSSYHWWSNWPISNGETADFYHMYLPTVKELLGGGLGGGNTWDLLYVGGVAYAEASYNETLARLNSVLNMSSTANCYGPMDDTGNTVKTKLYLSNDQYLPNIPGTPNNQPSTIVGIPVSTICTTLYPKGPPASQNLPDMVRDLGDGTVPALQAALPWANAQGTATHTGKLTNFQEPTSNFLIDVVAGPYGPHIGLMLNNKIIEAIKGDLSKGRTDVVFPASGPAARVISATQASTGLTGALDVLGQALPCLSNAAGTQTGWTSVGTVGNLAGVDVHFGQASSSFKLAGPADGGYTLSLTGIAEETVTLRAQALNGDATPLRSLVHVLKHSGTYILPMQFSASATPSLTFAPVVQPVANLTAVSNASSMTRLTWTCTDSPVGFKVYARNLSENTYNLLASPVAVARSTDLSVAWSDQSKRYIVLALSSTGVESPFLGEVGHLDQFVAIPTADKTTGRTPLQVSFNSSACLGTPATYAWDFGDQGTSSAANPVHTYTQTGTYRATLTIANITGTVDSRALTITAVPPVMVNVAAATMGCFSGETVVMTATVANATTTTAVTWSTSAGTIDPTGRFTAPGTPGAVTVTATSVEDTTKNASVTITVRSADFDGNSATYPKLLALANAIGSTAAADLAKYDFNGDGVIDDADLAKLFQKMGW
ncbi:MAG: PKD domain-containing protein [Holophagaceae bacterium]|nr:PKD domain-containing protein [Holophagaceae bacterium]